MHEEDDVKKVIICTIAALFFLTGCGNQNNQASDTSATPKWKGAPYHLVFGPAPAKPNSAGLTIPPITYNANPDMLETRANLVVEFDPSSAKSNGPVMDQMVVGAVDIPGSSGTLPADYVAKASTDFSKMLAAYCVRGKVKVSVALTRSSIPLNATSDQINDHRLSDWTPIDLDFKNPHPKC
jgi:uncharacterized lipoprotein NlpE involved in copper resistance